MMFLGDIIKTVPVFAPPSEVHKSEVHKSPTKRRNKALFRTYPNCDQVLTLDRPWSGNIKVPILIQASNESKLICPPATSETTLIWVAEDLRVMFSCINPHTSLGFSNRGRFPAFPLV